MPPSLYAPREAGPSPKAATTSGPQRTAAESLRDHGGAAYKQSLASGKSRYLADDPNQVGHRGVPVLVAAQKMDNFTLHHDTALAEPVSDQLAFPALPERKALLELDIQQDNGNIKFNSPACSNLAGRGGNHVMTVTPRQIQRTSGNASENSKENTGKSSTGKLEVRKEKTIQRPNGTVGEAIDAVKQAKWATGEDFDDLSPAPTQTRAPPRLDASKLRDFAPKAPIGNSSIALKDQRLEPSKVEVGVNATAARTPTKTLAPDTILAARGIGVPPQFTQLVQGISGTQHNTPGHSATQRERTSLSEHPRRVSPLHLPLPFGTPPPHAGFVAYPQAKPTTRGFLPSSAPRPMSHLRPCLAFQGAEMGSGYEAAVEAMTRKSSRSNAPPPVQEPAGSLTQREKTEEAAQNDVPQACGQPAPQTMDGQQQSHLAVTGCAQQSLNSNLPSFESSQGTQSNVLQPADHEQSQTSFMSDYNNSPSESSFLQIPGAFEQYRRRAFEALPPPSLAPDYGSCDISSSSGSRVQVPPGFEKQFAQPDSSVGHGILQQLQVAPAFQTSSDDYAGTQQLTQELQSSHDPPSSGNGVSQPREIAAQTLEISEDQDNGSAVLNQPLMKAPPGLLPTRASFSASEAQNDSQNIAPPPGFEPRHQGFVAPPPEESVRPQSAFETSAPRYVKLSSKGQQPSVVVDDSDADSAYPAQTAPNTVYQPLLNTISNSNPVADPLSNAHRVFEAAAGSTREGSAQIRERGLPESSVASQAMGSWTFKATQQNATAHTVHNGVLMEDTEAVEGYGEGQAMPARLEELYLSLMSPEAEEEGLGGATESKHQTRAISPPRIVGGEHHASRHRSPRRSLASGRGRDPSPVRRSVTPLQHTQPHVQSPRLPPPPGIIYMPSPYSTARPARAGDETPTQQLNRLLIIAQLDGYMPSHLTLFTDTSYAAFEEANPEYRLTLRADTAYRKPYEDWKMQNETKVPPRITPPGLTNWMNMAGSGAWAATVDPRSIHPTAPTTLEDESVPVHVGQTTVPASKSSQPNPSPRKPAVLRQETKPIQESKGKDKQPASTIQIREENKDTSTEEDDKAAMIQQAIELSLRDSLPRFPAAELAGPAPSESLRQSKLSAEALPFQSPAVENIVPYAPGTGSGLRGRSGQSSKPSEAFTLPKQEGRTYPPLSKSNSNASTASVVASARPKQHLLQPKPVPTQPGHNITNNAKLVSPLESSRVLAYIADVPASVSATAIRNVLNSFGKAVNIDVNRHKKIAYAEFASLAAFQAAVAANPHKIGDSYIRVQPRRPEARLATTSSVQSSAKIAAKAEPPRPIKTPQPATKPIEEPVVKQKAKVAWPNAPKPVPRPIEIASQPKQTVAQALPQTPKPQSKVPPMPAVKAVYKATKPRTPEPSAGEVETKPSVLLEPPKTPPRFRERLIPATPPTPRTQALIELQTVGNQDRNFLALPELEEVLENPPIIRKSAKTSRRAVEKAAKKAKALLAMEARAEVAGSRLGMGKAVLEQIGALPETDTDATITDDETGKKIKKPAFPKKLVLKGIEVIPGVETNENHSKDVYVDRGNMREKFVVSRGQMKEVDLEKKARKEAEIAATQLAHKVRAAEMKSTGKALSSLTDDWEDEEDRILAAESAARTESRPGSSTGLEAGGPPVLMALGADFDGWKTTIPRPPSSLAAEGRSESQERPGTAMSMHSNLSMSSSSLPVPLFPSMSLPSAKDPTQFVEPAVIPPPLNRHIAPAKPLNEIIAAEAALRGGVLEDRSAAPDKAATPSSWAQLAGKASAPTSADTSRRGSSEVIELRSRSASAVGGKNLMTRFTKAPGAVQSIKYDTNPQNKRTVYILGVPNSTTLTDISDSVSSGGYGPIYKIEFGVDADTDVRLAGVLFRDAGEVVPGIHGTAWGATGYYTALKNACDSDYLKEPPLWPWPLDAPITVYLQEYPEEELMRRMHHDSSAIGKGRQPLVTRHLCLVNKGKLHHDWHEEEMIAFCHASGVKQGNVQACCVHNFGNATLVFGSVEDAVMMRSKLLDKFKESKGLSVTYSTCPGEHQGPMQYKRDNVYLRHLENTMGVDVEQEIQEGQYREKKRRNSRWTAN